MTSLTIEEVRPDQGDCYWKLIFNYNEEFIEWLKATIPHTERDWHPVEVFWTVAEQWRDTVIEKAQDIFEHVWITKKEGDATVEIDAVTGQRTVQPSLFSQE